MMVMFIIVISCKLTNSEVFSREIRTETIVKEHWPHQYTKAKDLRFSRKDQTFKVNKLFILGVRVSQSEHALYWLQTQVI